MVTYRLTKNRESPSNQLKIFRQQLVEVKVAISSLFMGLYSDILPYATAFLMVVKEMAKALASLFDIKLSDYNTGIASQEGIYDGIEESADNAVSAVKELKRQTLGFDEIHNINENTDSGSGSTSVSGGIDQRLLDAIQGYDNGMESVRMKATEIRDNIMDWLGFTKEIDPLTGEVSFKYQDIKTTLKNMWTSFKGLSTTGKILVGLGLVTGATKLWNVGKKLVTVFGDSGLGKSVKSLLSPISSLFGWMKLGVQVNGDLTTGIKDGLKAWGQQNILVKNTDGSLNKWKTTMNSATTAVKGFVLGAAGIGLIYDSVKNLTNGTSNLLTVIGLVGGTILTIGGALTTVSAIATAFGVTMTTAMAASTAGISLVVAAVAGLVAWLVTSKSKTSEYEQALKELQDTANNSVSVTMGQINRTQELTNELNSLVSSTGKVKASDEERVNYILTKVNEAYNTEYELINGKITKNGEEIQSNDELIASIDEVMKKKKAESVLNAYQETYNEALRQQNEILKKAETLSETKGELSKKQKKELEELNEQYLTNQETIKNYEKLEQDVLTGSIEAIEKSIKKFYDDSQATYNQAFRNFQSFAEDTRKVCLAKLGKLNYTIGINADTSQAQATLNTFGNQLNRSGLGINFTPFSYREFGGVFSNGLWKNIPQYANGGIPSHGSMFVAGERGAEIVGNINGRTEVLNQSQIASAIYSAVYSAMSQFNGGGVAEINVHADKGIIVETAVTGIQQHVKQTGSLPFTVPVQ